MAAPDRRPPSPPRTAHLRKGETFADLAGGFTVGVATAHRYNTEALTLLAAMAPTLEEAIAVAAGKAYVISTAACCASTESPWPARTTAPTTPANSRSTD